MTLGRLAIAALTLLIPLTGCATPKDQAPPPVQVVIVCYQGELLPACIQGYVYTDGTRTVTYQVQERAELVGRREVVMGIVPAPDRRRQIARRRAEGSALVAVRAE